MSKKILVVFDLNGVLCYRQKDTSSGSYDFVVEGRGIVLRPGCRQFLKNMYRKYDVAFFSSMTQKTGLPLIKELLTPEQLKATKFTWFRDRTRIDWNDEGYGTLKNISDIVDNPIVNWGKKLLSQDIILVDDSETKVRYNDERNLVLVDSFEGDTSDDFLLTLPHLIAEKADKLRS